MCLREPDHLFTIQLILLTVRLIWPHSWRTGTCWTNFIRFYETFYETEFLSSIIRFYGQLICQRRVRQKFAMNESERMKTCLIRIYISLFCLGQGEDLSHHHDVSDVGQPSLTSNAQDNDNVQTSKKVQVTSSYFVQFVVVLKLSNIMQ
jgi:hypothetical protein